MFPACLRFAHSSGPSGPFDVPPILHTRRPRYDELYYTVSCRSEIMTTLAELLLLDNDAVYRSFTEGRPLRDYKSPIKARKAELLYHHQYNPYSDLTTCVQGCSYKWGTLVQYLL